MSTKHLRLFFGLILAAALVGCASSDTDPIAEPQAQPEAEEPTTEIIFRGRWHERQECYPDEKGMRAYRDVLVCDVLEVLQGELHLIALRGVVVPKEARHGVVYIFRWRVDPPTLRRVRRTEADGYHVMWINTKLELVEPEPAKP